MDANLQNAILAILAEVMVGYFRFISGNKMFVIQLKYQKSNIRPVIDSE